MTTTLTRHRDARGRFVKATDAGAQPAVTAARRDAKGRFARATQEETATPTGLGWADPWQGWRKPAPIQEEPALPAELTAAAAPQNLLGSIRPIRPVLPVAAMPQRRAIDWTLGLLGVYVAACVFLLGLPELRTGQPTAAAPTAELMAVDGSGNAFVAGSGDTCEAAWQGAVLPTDWQEIYCLDTAAPMLPARKPTLLLPVRKPAR